MRPDIKPGATFPDYQLLDQRGRPRRLSELQGMDPMILILARGHYCPKDRQQHRRLVEFWPEINVAYTRIVTISTDDLLATNEFRDGVGAPWPFLSDPERVIQRDLDIAEYTDPQHDPMTPHTLVLAPSLRIVRIYNGYWYWGRPSPEDLHRDLRELFAEIRPDWDLAKPGLREKWEAGDREDFWPYGRSMSEVFAAGG
jgi:peroxiredoxin